MPRKAKDTTEIEKIEKVEKTPSSRKKASTSSSSRTSKTTTTRTKSATKKVATEETVTTSKATTKKKKTTTNTKSRTSTPASKKTGTKTEKKTSTAKKTASKTATATIKKVEILEYYDLPYRYNETVVKVLAQTPNTLFVYWDISDDDKNRFISEYGDYFFHNTKPVLIIHNQTMHYSYEIDINDFANSWYLRIPDSNCHYQIELGRRPINTYVSIPNNYLPISYSNQMDAPNDHILFEELADTVTFRNVKTNQEKTIAISSILSLKAISNLLPIQKLYQQLYQEEDFQFDRFNLSNPSSGNPTSTFK